MVINGWDLLHKKPIKNMMDEKKKEHGVSHGLSEVGYDIRLKQQVVFDPKNPVHQCYIEHGADEDNRIHYFDGNFLIASAIEEFDMPEDLVAIVHDKSTWARHGLSVFNTVIEPGWKGFLTLELVYHGRNKLVIPAGSGIAQVIFHDIACSAKYSGKYQNQADKPVQAIRS